MTELPIPAALAVDVEPFTDEQLDAKLDEVAASSVVDTYGPNRFAVDDDNAAEWCARKYAIEQAAIQAVKDQADEWIERIQAWEVVQVEKARKRAEFFEQHLIGYMARLRRESEYTKKDGTVDWRVKSVALPSAVLKSSRQSARVKLAESEDAQAQAVEWCESNGQSDAVKRTLLVSKLSGVSVKDGRAVSEGGEVVPGLVVEPESVTYKVTLP